jgi:uncharacterized protein YjlB
MADQLERLTLRFGDAGTIPNNPGLPVLVYRRAAPEAVAHDSGALAAWFEKTWSQHAWQAAWRWGVYPFPHYHSTAHEALGVYRGRASLRLGDSAGVTLVVEPGDLLILPEGTAHQNLGSSEDFHVVGGYPAGQSADLLRGEPGERPAADERISRVLRPSGDPLHGRNGELMRIWPR